RSLLQLDALDQIEQLQALVDRTPMPAGQRMGWGDLARRGLLPGVPLDPEGTPYALQPDARQVTLAPDSSLYPLPALTHPSRHPPRCTPPPSPWVLSQPWDSPSAAS